MTTEQKLNIQGWTKILMVMSIWRDHTSGKRHYFSPSFSFSSALHSIITSMLVPSLSTSYSANWDRDLHSTPLSLHLFLWIDKKWSSTGGRRREREPRAGVQHNFFLSLAITPSIQFRPLSALPGTRSHHQKFLSHLCSLSRDRPSLGEIPKYHIVVFQPAIFLAPFDLSM